ncbi:MAG: hypothetical protein ABR936_16845 [Bacteroidota bacterium]|jgi:hypothetical protein
MMTVEEALKCKDPKIIYEWFRVASPRQLEEYTHHAGSLEGVNWPFVRDYAMLAIQIRLSEILAENTHKLITLTRALHWLTIVLVIIAVLQTIILVVHH